MLHQGGPTASIAVIERLVDLGDEAKARAMADLVVGEWPPPDTDGGTVRAPRFDVAAVPEGDLRSRLLTVLARMKDTGPLARFVTTGLSCKCASCAEVRAFLAHDVTTSWSLKAAKDARRHVEDAVRAARVDVDLRTEARGSPHTLICTKNDASYQVRVRQRAQDLAAVARLDANGDGDPAHARNAQPTVAPRRS